MNISYFFTYFLQAKFRKCFYLYKQILSYFHLSQIQFYLSLYTNMSLQNVSSRDRDGTNLKVYMVYALYMFMYRYM